MNATEVLTVYHQRIKELEATLAILKKKRNTISWIRFGITILAIIFIWQCFSKGWLFIVLPVIVWLIIFLRLVIVAAGNNSAIAHFKSLIGINQQEIDIANGLYTNLPDGKQFMPATHDYANDLDIFGRASLYQYINRTVSGQGNSFLAEKLLHPSTLENITEIHEAAKELSPQYQWRQDLQAHGLENPISNDTQNKIDQWLQEPLSFTGKTFWQIIRILVPVITISTLILHITGFLSAPQFYALVAIYFIVSSLISKNITKQYISLNKVVGQVTTLSNSIACIEKLSSQTPLLNKIHACFISTHFKASAELKGLKSILDKFDIRLNPLVFFPLNTFLLWDLQLIFQLEKWKQKNHKNINTWFDNLGEIEFLSSIANLHFNHPAWVFPQFVQEHRTFIASNVGHPLITESKRVSSDFFIQGTPQLALVTGSNMAGKSTFLRSVGTNIVLAMMGAPVCANSCKLAPMRVVSTMRVADNLEESTSTFYAELKKLQYIIEAVNRNEKVFLLFDEILRGTNSADRHLGSKALIRQLIDHKATGILATHDLELTNLSGEYPSVICNYHFDMQLKNNNELFFDYKLKTGICKTMNAAFLMKMIGIEM